MGRSYGSNAFGHALIVPVTSDGVLSFDIETSNSRPNKPWKAKSRFNVATEADAARWLHDLFFVAHVTAFAHVVEAVDPGRVPLKIGACDGGCDVREDLFNSAAAHFSTVDDVQTMLDLPAWCRACGCQRKSGAGRASQDRP
jgi:hypothetical protein